jgi:hypothetical protein
MLCNTVTFSKRRKKKVQHEYATPFASIARFSAEAYAFNIWGRG